MDSSITVDHENNDGGYIALKGFSYQFDKTIAEIFDHPKTSVNIKQVQDLNFDDYVIQVKHHDTRYSPSQIRARKKKPIIQLLDLYEREPSRHYILYIYLKEVPSGHQSIWIDELNTILGAAASTYKTSLKPDFLKKLQLIHADDYLILNASVIKKIKVAYSCTDEEAKFWYTVISAQLLKIVIDTPPSQRHKRTTSLTGISTQIKTGRDMIFRSS